MSENNASQITRSVCWSVVSRRANGRQHRGNVSVRGGLACVNSGLTNLSQRQSQDNNIIIISSSIINNDKMLSLTSSSTYSRQTYC